MVWLKTNPGRIKISVLKTINHPSQYVRFICRARSLHKVNVNVNTPTRVLGDL